MKFSGKRVLSAILCVSLLLSLGVFSARAEKAQTLPVAPQIAAEDAVYTAEAQVVYTAEVGGHDYMFIFMNDYMMLVYDLDTKELVDIRSGEAEGLFVQPRAAVMDSKGNLWACGQGAWLYKYNPVTKQSQKITFSKSLFGIDTLNLFGIAVDEADNVYFGTSNKGYFGMYDGKTVSCISEWLDPVNSAKDSYYAGYGGLIVRDGYIYAAVEGDNNADGTVSHYFIEYNIAEQKIVRHLNVERDLTEKAGQYRQVTDLGGGYVLLSSNARMSAPVLVNTNTMNLVEVHGWDTRTGSFGYAAVKDGYAYVTARMDSSGMYQIKIPTTANATETTATKLYAGLQLDKTMGRGDTWVTVDGKEYLFTYRNNYDTDTVDPVFYDVQKQEMQVWEQFTKVGSGSTLRNIITDPERKNLFVGGYGSDRIAQYNIETGKVVKLHNSYAEQTDSLCWYNGKIYAGNYSECTITEVDLENETSTAFFRLNGTIFNQYRAHALTAGDGKVFLGTVPASSKNGGILAWVDLDTKITYVAAGPSAEDVYSCQTNGTTFSKYEWTRVATRETVKELSFTGLVENQTVNNIIYKDGLLYGSTTIYGGSGSNPDTKDAVLFVYDVQNMQMVKTCDLKTVLGLSGLLEWVDALAEDPQVPGKFWGVAGNVLFSFTFDGENFSVKKELTVGTLSAYTGSGNRWDHRSIVFDGIYMYVVLPQSGDASGTYMINRTDVSDCILLSQAIPKQMEMGEDGQLYYALMSADLFVLPVAEYTQPRVAASVREVIDALPAGMTAENKAQFDAAKDMYDALIPATKTLVDGGVFTRPYSVGDATYSDLSAAISAAAQSGMPVALNQDVAAQEVLLTDGVTLDLNGYTLTAEDISANVPGGIAEGFVVDSSAGNEGLLCTERIEDIFWENNPDLPVYDTAASGYRFFDYKLTVHGKPEKVSAGKQKFWFKFHFYTDDTCTEQDVDAYDLVYADGSNLTVSVDVAWNSGTPKPVYFGRPDGNGRNSTALFSREWAKDATLSRWLYVVVGGLDKLEDGTLRVTPGITVNGVQVTGETTTYQKITKPIPDYGWSDGIQ